MRHGTTVYGGSRSAPPRGERPGGRRKRLSTGQKVAGWLSVAVVTILVVAVLGLYVQFRSDFDSIKRIDVQSIVGKQPPKLNSSENILLIGSDTRIGQHGIGGVNPGNGRSDTLMLMHISAGTAGHRTALVMSIPRDTMVPFVGCPANNGFSGQSADPNSVEKINATLASGGPACVWKTVAAQTGIHIDHFIQLDFIGFQKVVNDIGGVNVCLPFAVHDPKAGLNLSAGLHHVYGHEALAFWREREDVGLGSDLQRIQRDQYLMAALVQGMVHSGLLGSPTKVLAVIRDASASMTVDTGFDENAMLQLAESMRGLNTSNVQFVTAPNVPYPADPAADVSFDQPKAGELFSAIAHDNVAPASRSARPAPRPTAPPPVVAAPSQVKVEVQNGSGVQGVATQVGNALTGKGFTVVGTGDAANFNYTNSVIEYSGAAELPEVNTLKAEVPNVQTMPDPALAPGTLTLIVGSSFSSLNTSPTPASGSSPSPSATNLAAGDGAIAGNVRICKNGATFAGPNSP